MCIQEDSDAEFEAALSEWPNCSVPDCPNKACLTLDSQQCYPHTIGKPLNFLDDLTPEERAARSEMDFEEMLRMDLEGR